MNRRRIARRYEWQRWFDVASTGRTLEPHETCLPLLYGETEIGHLIVQGPLDAALALRIEGLLLHAATALVQRRLRRAEKQALDAYCACVEAMHEGVGLFQEADSEIASARFLELCASAVKASAGAVLLREEFGNIESRLCIESLLGVPENFLEQLADRSGRWWPATVQGSGLVHLSRPGPGHELPVLDPACVPPALLDVVACPLEYQLFPVGLLLLFNLEIADDERRAKLSGLQSLGNLGAVVFHRQAIDRGRS